MSETKYELLVVTNDCEETFDLEKVPGKETELVKEQKKQLSAELDLRRLVVNLNNTSTLLYISYNALSGTSVQSKVSGLQKQLSDLCAQSQAAMGSIRSNTEIVFEQLPTVYTLLVSGKAPAAMELLASCSIYAGKMARISEELAEGFEKMADKAQGALEGSQDLYANDLKKKQEIADQINEMRAKQAKLKKQSEELQGTLQEVEERYADARRREERAEKNAMIMGIVNVCASTLSFGLGALAEQTKSRQETRQNMQSSKTGAQQKESQKELQKVQEELEAQEQAVSEAQEELAAAERELSKIEAEAQETEEGDYAEKKEAAEQKVKELKDKVAKEKKSAENKKKAVEAAQAALDGLSEQLAKEREDMKHTLEKAEATTSEIFQMKLNMQKENREIAGEMAEMAEILKGQQDLMISTDKAVEMLKLAIRCLGNIVVAFSEMALFWRSIEQGCKNLQDGAFMMQVKTFAQFDSELQKTMYEGENFKKTILTYMATWVALHAISTDYYVASQAIGKKVRGYIGKNLFGEEAFKEASRLAEEIIGSMQEEQQSIDENNAVIEKIRLGISTEVR